MTFDDLSKYFETLPEKIMADVPFIVADTATEYFKDSFTRKGFDGVPWTPARVKKERGSLLVDTSKLLNSIHPVIVTPYKVVIGAGGRQVTYARVHNEGYDGPVSVPRHTRTSRKGNVHTVRAHTRNVHIPQRRYMGEAAELVRLIHDKVSAYVKSKSQI